MRTRWSITPREEEREEGGRVLSLEWEYKGEGE